MATNAHSMALLVAGVIVAVNAIYLAMRGGHLRRRYPTASIPGPLSLVWGSLLLSTVSIWLGQHLVPSPGALLDPAWGVGVIGAMTVLVGIGWLSFLVDARVRKLPTELTYLMAAEVLAAWFVSFVIAGFPIEGVLGPLLGALLWSIVPLIGVFAGQVGRGDVRLAPVLGFALGTTSVTAAMVGLILSYLLAGIVALFIRSRGATGRDRFSLGPFLLIATWLTLAISALVPMLATLAHV